MERDFTIYIDQTYDWEIRAKYLNNYNYLDNFNSRCKFAILKQRDKKIAYLYDTKLDNSDIEIAKSESIYNEICNFKDETTGKRFRGTFIDTLNYIKKVFK